MATGGVEVGALYATLKLDKSKFERSVHESGVSLGGLARIAATGGVVIGAALLGIGVAAVHSASGFQAAMELIATQAGASQDEVEALKKSVLGLAGEVATSPEELAKGLYHLESAGLHGAKAMEVLKIAAEGAKVGHADLESVTNALVASLKSGVGGITDASQAMGVLNAIVGAGNMRMEDLTAAIGTGVLSSAKNFGVSIQSVGAALAAMTDQGIPAVDAANSIRSAMRLMAAPTKAAVGELKSIGLTQQSLAKDLRSSGGIQSAMVDLKKHMEAAGLSATEQAQLLTKAFGGKQSQGILTLIGNMDVLDAKQKAVSAGAGGFAAAWAKTQQDVAIKADKAKASFEALTITLGDRLLPVAGSVFDALTGFISSPALLGAVDSLGSAMASIATLAGTAFGKIADVVRSVGPTVVTVFGKIIDTVQGFVTGAMPAVTAAFAFLSGAIKGVVDAFTPVMANSEELKGFLIALGAIVLTIVVPPFVAWAAATLVAAAPLLLIAAAVAGLILVLEHFGILGPVVEGVTRALGGAFDWVTTNVLPALMDAFNLFTGTILPAIIAGVSVVADTVIPAFGAAFEWITTNILPPIMEVISVLANVVLPALLEAFRGVVSWVVANLPTMRKIWETVSAAIGAVIHAAATAVKTAFEIIANVIKVVVPVIVNVGKVIFPALGAAATVLLSVMSTIFSSIGTVWNLAWSVAKTVASGIGSAWNGLIGVIRTVWNSISGIVRGGANFLIGIVNGIISAVDSIQVHIGRIGIDTPGGFIGVGPFDWNGLNIGHLGYLEAGTPNWRGGWALLGEKGPELAKLPSGAQVFSSHESARILAQQGGQGQSVEHHYNLTVAGDVKADKPESILSTLQRMSAVGPTSLVPVTVGTKP